MTNLEERLLESIKDARDSLGYRQVTEIREWFDYFFPEGEFEEEEHVNPGVEAAADFKRENLSAIIRRHEARG